MKTLTAALNYLKNVASIKTYLIFQLTRQEFTEGCGYPRHPWRKNFGNSRSAETCWKTIGHFKMTSLLTPELLLVKGQPDNKQFSDLSFTSRMKLKFLRRFVKFQVGHLSSGIDFKFVLKVPREKSSWLSPFWIDHIIIVYFKDWNICILETGL